MNAAVSIAAFAVGPGVSITAGGTVTWTNNDTSDHDVTANDGSFASKNMPPGAVFSARFERPGTFAYVCTVHPFMTATVTVR